MLGHASRSPLWDIPKGMVEPGETLVAAALRELGEETGLLTTPDALIDLGVHVYMPGKDLALFAWKPDPMPDPAHLTCTAMVQLPRGGTMPEMDKFAVFDWPIALTKVGRNLARVLSSINLVG